MNGPIRRSALVVFSVFLLLLAALSYTQVLAGPGYRDDPRNARVALSRAGRERGAISTADGVLVATSVAMADDPRSFQRSYPHGSLYAHVVGYASALFGNTGLERVRAEDLTSGRNSTISALLTVLGGGDLRPRALRITIDHALQETAAAALGDQRGAVVALDPRTGAVLAMVTSPGFDPNTLLGGDPEAGDLLDADPARPLLNRATSEVYPPGSTFKVITAAAALERGLANPSTRFPDVEELELPGTTSTVRNFDRGLCGDGSEVSLAVAFERSCNTVFAALGMEVGAEALIGQARAFGFDAAVPFDLEAGESKIPDAVTFRFDLPGVAQSALGQRDVRATPLMMAMVASAVANDGVVMAPYIVDTVFDADGDIVAETPPVEWRRAISPATADTLTGLMENVVVSGTGRRAAVPGVRVAGKTGTAQVAGSPPHAWFIGFGPIDPVPGGPQIAVAVIVESGGDAGETATGGSVAAPIAQAVLAEWINRGS